jgi:hypothetical protein
MSHTDDTDDFVDLSEPERATAYFAKSIALLMFTIVLAGVATGIAAASRASWLAGLAGLGCRVLLWLAFANYLDGNRCLKR